MARYRESFGFPTADRWVPVFLPEVLCGRACYPSNPVQDNWDRRLSSASRTVDERAQGCDGPHQPHQIRDNASRRDYMQTERFLGVAALFFDVKKPIAVIATIIPDTSRYHIHMAAIHMAVQCRS